MLATLQGSPMANPESLKDKAQGKCLIYRQARRWAKECPNCDKSPKMACYKCHQLGHWVAPSPKDTRNSRSSSMPSLDGSTGLKCLAPASPSVTDNHHWLEPTVKLDVTISPRSSQLTQGLPTLSWPPVPEPFPLNPVSFWMLEEKQLQKDSLEHFFVAGMDKYFPTRF